MSEVYADSIQAKVNGTSHVVPIRDSEATKELMDIRTGADGKNYKTAGEAVRFQFQQNSFLLGNFFKSKNLLIPEIISHGFIDEFGDIRENEIEGKDYYYTDYIENPCYPKSCTIVMSVLIDNKRETPTNVPRYVAYYDDAKQFISASQMTNYVKSPEGVKYFIVSYDILFGDQPQIELFEESPFSNYGYTPYIPMKPGSVYIAESYFTYEGNTWQNEYEKLNIPSGKYLAFAEYTTFRDYKTPSIDVGSISYIIYLTIEEVGGFSDTDKRMAIIDPEHYGPVFFEVNESQAYNMEIRLTMGAYEKLNNAGETHGYRIIIVKIDDPAIYYPYLGLKEPLENTIKNTVLDSLTNMGIKPSDNILKKTWDSTLTGTTRILQDNVDIKNGKALSFYTKVSNDFSMVRVGHGESQYGGTFVDVTTDKIAVYNYLTSASLVKEESHNLEISDFLSIVIDVHDTKATITISTSSGSYQLSNIDWSGYNGTVFFNALNGTFTDSILSWTAKSLDYPVWVFGDSYLGLTSSVRWPYYLRQMGFINWLVCGFPGATSEDQIICFNNLLAMKKPKYVIWCLGMNDSDTSSAINASYKSCLDDVMASCKEKNITLILSTIPNVPGRNHTFKNQYVKSLGIDFIDFEAAVGASSNGIWYDGMLSSDNVHPSALGAKALASRVVADAPVLMSNQ